LAVTFDLELEAFGGFLSVQYTPIAISGPVDQLTGNFTMGGDGTKPPDDEFLRVRGRGRLLGRALSTYVSRDALQLEVDGVAVDALWRVTHYKVDVDSATLEVTKYRHGGGYPILEKLPVGSLPSGARRLVDSLSTSATALAWDHFRRVLGLPIGSTDLPSSVPLAVFISYRATHEHFAEALAVRLGEEGIVPWFDKWEIRAGDSVPGKIEQGLRDSVAFLPVVSADYESGAWATEELRTAIVRRIETDFRIVPVLLERCEIPELIRHLRYVDFTNQDPDTFEVKVGEIIDGIYGLSLNPFRGSPRPRISR